MPTGGTIMAKLEFILGRAGTGKTESCLREMRKAMESEPFGNMLLMVVPEHMTYKVERELIARTKGRATMRGVVSGFRRLAWQASEKSRLPKMTEIGKRLILKKIIEKRANDLSVLASSAGQRGFTGALAELVEELKSYHGTPEALREAADALDDTYLSKKLNDIAMLYRDFLEETGNRFEDAEDRMANLSANIPKDSRFHGSEIWLDGFIFFNPQEREVIRAFVKAADTVHITLPLDRDVAINEEVKPSSLFYRAAHTLQRLKLLAEETGVSYTVRLLEKTYRFQPEAKGIAALERGIFRFPVRPEANVESACGIRVIEAATRRLELEAAGADMIRLCREKGFRWRDIGILLRDGENYGELLEFVLQEYDIPFFTDRKRAGVHHPLAELLRSALEMLTDGWSYDAVFRCVKTDLLPLSNDEADILENYVLEFGIRGESSWCKEWPYLHRRSMEEGADGGLLRTVNGARKKVADPFLSLANALKAETVRDKTCALHDFLTCLHVPEQLAEWAEEARSAGALEEAKEHLMIWGQVTELFDQMVSVSGEESIALDDYAALLTDGLDAMELSLIPQKIDTVTIASFDQNSLNNIRALYILGANEGIMPRRPSAGGILSEADRALLSAQNEKVRFELSNTAEEESCCENYLLYHGFTEAREYLWVSYFLADSEGKGLGRSSVVTRLLKLLPAIELQSVPLEGMTKEKERRLLFATGKHAVSRLVPYLREYVASPKSEKRGEWGAVYNWALYNKCKRLPVILKGLFAAQSEETLHPEWAKRIFARNNKLTGSVTRFECYYKCPFWHFAQYGLLLRDREEYGFHPMDHGTIMHDLMRKFGEKARREGRSWSDVPAEERAAFVRDTIEKTAAQEKSGILVSTAQYKNLVSRIAGTADSSIARLSEWSRISAFSPRYFELSFGNGKAMGAILSWELPNQGVELDIAGQIDRIDCGEIEGEAGKSRPYFLVIDYKTGDEELSLKEVYYGIRLQLLTYLAAAKKFFLRQGKIDGMRPAGMLYCMLKNPVVAGTGKMNSAEAEAKLLDGLRMKGWLLDDVNVIKNIDDLARFIRVKLNKAKTGIDGRYKNNIKDEQEFDALAAYALQKLQDAGGAVLSGDIKIHPFQTKQRSACTFCPYRDVCGFEAKYQGSSEFNLDDADIIMQKINEEQKGGRENGQR